MIWFLTICLLLPAFAPQRPARKPAPQAAPAAPNKWPIQTLTVEGNHHYTREQVLSVAGLKPGEVAGKQEFEAARDRLVATGAFQTVGYRFAPSADGKGYAASFQVTEAEPVYPVRFEELSIPPDELTRRLKAKDPLFGPQIAGTTAVIDRYTGWISEWQKEKVIARMLPEGSGFSIVFRPARSSPAVAEVRFEGNQVIPTNALRLAIAGVAIGVSFTEERFRQLLDTSVRPLYDARGRLKVAFPRVTAERATDVNGLVVKVSVVEGPSYDLGEVQFENHSEVKTDELRKVAAFKSGEMADFDQINQGIERIRKRLRRQGYMTPEIKMERKLDDPKKTVNLAVRIQEGAQFLFGKLNIEGLDINGEAAIRKLWSLKEGKPFNADYPGFFLDRVREDNLFDNLGKTRYTTKVDEQNHTVDVTLYFR